MFLKKFTLTSETGKTIREVTFKKGINIILGSSDENVRSRRICHSFAEILTLLKISAVPNKLQFRNENKSDDTVAFYFTNYI